jgi:MFS family permease
VLSDPVSRALTWSTLGGALAKGLFFSISALFFTRVIGLSATSVGLGLTLAGAVGVAASFAAGYLADRIGAAPVLVVATVGQGAALLAYLAAANAVTFAGIACVAVGLQAAQRTAQSTLLARHFTGPDRVAVRARLRVITNVFIGIGTAGAALALLVDTAAAYRVAMVTIGILVLLSGIPLRGLRRTGSTVTRVTERGRSPLTDRGYLAVTALYTILSMQFGLLTVGLPLWVTGRTHAPAVTVAVLIAMNTVLVALFQVPASRGTHEVPLAGRAVFRASAALAVACGLYAAAVAGEPSIAVALLVAGGLAHAAGEVLCEAGSWGLAFELADPASAGAYQGVSTTGAALGNMLAPLVVTATAIDHGTAGWAFLAALFLAAGAGTLAVAKGMFRPAPALPERPEVEMRH